ncbi:hypothetical protein CES85_3682 (plasmid) [Ochrobactrum quorumnocens]|uniref:Uncharacterized protein n=1 Tax=Ochrobactrum quorumnocens TaxID=271865 RepID=A0A248UPB1_9HYPH|nr:hypothetical protein CES85_3682 [[Ochrobactrum] quorumnocens]
MEAVKRTVFVLEVSWRPRAGFLPVASKVACLISVIHKLTVASGTTDLRSIQ